VEITVRGAVAGDIRVLVDFNLRMAEETEGKSLDGETLAAGVEAVVVGTESEGVPTGRYLVAEVDGRVVGALMHTWEWSDWRNGVVWWLQSVFVEPEFRRRGVFRLLYETLRSQARNGERVVGLRLYVEGDNRGAQATYARLGMSPSGYTVMEELFTESAERG
tara:strand:+ start:1564 stop:2052 length:489 start_codon:yes stop_codon:yes gene_type:complete